MNNPRYSYPHGSMRSIESGFYPVYRTGPTNGDLYRATSVEGESFWDWLKELDRLTREDIRDLKAMY